MIINVKDSLKDVSSDNKKLIMKAKLVYQSGLEKNLDIAGDIRLSTLDKLVEVYKHNDITVNVVDFIWT